MVFRRIIESFRKFQNFLTGTRKNSLKHDQKAEETVETEASYVVMWCIKEVVMKSSEEVAGLREGSVLSQKWVLNFQVVLWKKVKHHVISSTSLQLDQLLSKKTRTEKLSIMFFGFLQMLSNSYHQFNDSKTGRVLL